MKKIVLIGIGIIAALMLTGLLLLNLIKLRDFQWENAEVSEQ